ncbi:MAG: glycosyltransferase family 2 protein [Thermodesulfobacteriota bacterium]|nr:glycosyltransferase family 2 protein [Thermodesulfobacteriota bacterium]
MQLEGISIIVPTYNDIARTRMCLDAIYIASLRLSSAEIAMLEVIVVDDASPQPFRYAGAGIEFVCQRFEVNKGVGTARNAGACLAKHNYLLFIDADVQVAENFLITAFNYLRQNQVKVLQGIGSHVPANGDPTLFHHYMAISWHFFQVKYCRDFLWTLCTIISKPFFFQVGGFAEDYAGSGGEEFELTARLLQADRGAITCAPGLMFFHHYSGVKTRARKLLRRSPRLKETIFNHSAWPLMFQLEAGLRAFFAVCLTLTLLLLLFQPIAAVIAYLVFGCLLFVSDGQLSMAFLRRHSLRLAVASIFFRQIEYMIVLCGILWGKREK